MSFSSYDSFLDRVVVGGLRVHEDGRDFGSVMADLWRWAAGAVLTQMLAIVNGKTLSKASVKLRYSSALASP